MNKTYKEDTGYCCWLCGDTVEEHVAALQCSNVNCPTNNHDLDIGWMVLREEQNEIGKEFAAATETITVRVACVPDT